MGQTVVLKNFDFAQHTDRGRVRDRNEDSLAYFDSINGHIFIVCDGMGGHNAGDVASELAVEAVKDFLNEKYIPNPFEAIENAILHANKLVYNQALGNDYLLGMGTTIVLVLIRDDRVYYGHAGDSRLYMYRNHILDQMTEDHSIVQQLLKGGLISPKEAETHPKRHEITRALGLSMKFEPEVSPRAIIPQNDDFLLICSDGLSNLVNPDEICKILDNPFNINDKAMRLISKANKKGGTDNISAILIRFHNLGNQDDALDDNQEKPIMGKIRDLLKNRNFSYFLILLFVVGMSLLVFKTDKEELTFTKNPFRLYYQKHHRDLIIPYLLKSNETPESVANKFNIKTELIYNLNPNFEPEKPGSHLKIPVKDLYIVRQTDNLYLIAESYGINPELIMKANDLNALQLKIGTELLIPFK